ncbi:hypothetical protein [Speluncibacter jeojiensis]|nr:hypothetical protein [Rhodococcus sp. D2-41]
MELSQQAIDEWVESVGKAPAETLDRLAALLRGKLRMVTPQS